MNTAMQLQNVLRAGSLMQSVDVLRNNCPQFCLLLQFGKRQMRRVGPGAQAEHLLPIKTVELIRMFHEKVWLKIVSGGYSYC